MSKHKVNPERGEVELELSGETFVLCAEMARVAAFCAEIGSNDVQKMYSRLVNNDPVAIAAGVRHLCISDNADQLAAKFHFRDFARANMELCKAIGHGLEEGKDDAAEAETETTENP